MSVDVSCEKGRYYLIGNTFPARDIFKQAGCKWDVTRRAWWIGDQETANRLADQTNELSSYIDPDKPIILGRARHKDHDGYLVLWEGNTRKGMAALLCYRDGSHVFWSGAYEVTKRYQEPLSLKDLDQRAAEYKARKLGDIK